MRTRILVIDDEESICEILRFNLEKEGYEADCAYSAEDALEMDLTPYQLFIVDIMMDRLSGFDFAKKLKNNPALEYKPIIFCSALSGEDETVMGLNIGADDYITKPFVISEVIARVKAVLRRSGVTPPGYDTTRFGGGAASVQTVTPYQTQTVTAPTRQGASNEHHEPDIVFKGLRINRNAKSCTLDDELVRLTKKELDILLFFLTHRNRIYSREELIANIWGADVVVTDRAIDTNMARLRKKLGDYGAHIVTRLGFGYGFQDEI